MVNSDSVLGLRSDNLRPLTEAESIGFGRLPPSICEARTPTSVRVRISVWVGSDGSWEAHGRSMSGLKRGEQVAQPYTVEADIPLPPGEGC